MTPQHPPRFAAAVFDMDGLLLDSERPLRTAWMDAAAQHGCVLGDADYLSVVGLNHTDSHARFLTLFGGDASLLERVRGSAQELVRQRFDGRGFDAKPGALRLLQGLQRGGVACAVASSTHLGEVRRRLEAARLLRYFAAVCGGDEVAHGKPHPDLYALALTRLGVNAAQGVAFEDSGHGVRSAWSAGLAVVAVPDLLAPPLPWLQRCLAVFDTLEDVCRHSRAWFGIRCADAP